MTIPQVSNNYAVAVGTSSDNVAVPVFAAYSPTTANIRYPLGKRWINTVANASYELTSFSSAGGSVAANWTLLGTNDGPLDTLTGNTGGAIAPVAGNIDIIGADGITVAGSAGTLTISLEGGSLAIDSFTPDAGTDPVVPDSNGNVTMAGTANQITTTGGTNSLTFSVPAAFIAPGSIVATTTIASTTGLTAGTTFTATGGASSFGGGTFTVASGTNAINVSADAAATTVNLATGAGAKALTIGSTNTTSATTVQSGSGGITMTGVTTHNANVILNGSATQLRVHGGAVTDFIGTGTLTAGTVTIANTNIAAADRIFIQRTAANASTVLGMLTYTISAGASFTVTSLESATPGDTETGDASSFVYFIVRQTA